MSDLALSDPGYSGAVQNAHAVRILAMNVAGRYDLDAAIAANHTAEAAGPILNPTPLASNTRERIRRGLQRLANEPFAIRLTHGGAPRPLTLPLVTLTQRHDTAVVLPVGGNTYERSPGNRARRASERPLDTIHGTPDRAIVVPPMGSVDPRPAATAPAPTQTTTTRAALVTPDPDGAAA